jgi:hypothetical protein
MPASFTPPSSPSPHAADAAATFYAMRLRDRFSSDARVQRDAIRHYYAIDKIFSAAAIIAPAADCRQLISADIFARCRHYCFRFFDAFISPFSPAALPLTPLSPLLMTLPLLFFAIARRLRLPPLPPFAEAG